jgi:hypothetical protein
MNNKAVSGIGNPCPANLDVRGIRQSSFGLSQKQRSEQSFHKPAAGLAASPMRHLDLLVFEAHFRRGLSIESKPVQATALIDVTSDFRYS